MVDASAVARTVGVNPVFKDLRTGTALSLAQRIAVFAQGESAVTFALTKFAATSAKAVGARFGYKSPAYLVARELLPENGDGVGTVPVTIYPMGDNGSGVAAAGDITPSGTATAAGAYRIHVAGIPSAEFTIPIGAIDVTLTCAEIGKAISAILGMPVIVTYTYGTVTGVAGGSNTGDGTLTALSVTGTPLPGLYSLTCNTAAVDGGTFTLTDPDGVVISTTVGVTGANVSVGGIDLTLTDGAADFIVGDTFAVTVPATDVVLTAAWKGVSGNGILLEAIGDSLGVTFAFTQPTGGLVNPTVDAALLLPGNVWETMGLNALNGSDTTALNTFQTWGDGRWGELVRKPIVIFHGDTQATVAGATAVPAVRTTDKINSQLVAPGSPHLPCVVAARQLARIARLANNNPPHDYGGQQATGLTPGLDSLQWDFAARDLAVKAGSSTIEVKDGVINVSDVVTYYAPAGEPTPAFRFVVDIVKLMQVVYGLDLIFSSSEWNGAPLIPDADPTSNVTAKKPRMAKAAANNLIESLARQAVLSNPAAAKKLTTAVINGGNPKRLDVGVTVQLAGNTNQIPITLNFGFFFGAAALVA